MLLRRVAIQNVRSFRERAEFISDGMISISIGPNGGGKTNLLDTIVIVLRRFLLASNYPSPQPTPEQPDRHVFQHNDALNGMVLDRHTGGGDLDQIIECEVEVTQRDIENMHRMKNDGPQLRSRAARKYANPPSDSDGWHIEAFTTRQRFVYTIRNGGLENDPTQAGVEFKQYLQTFEADRLLRQEYGFAPLSTPLLYLSVNRSATAFQSRVQLAGYNDYEQKRQSDAVHSRGTASAIPLAVGRLAQKFRLLLELEGSAKQRFEQDDGVREITRQLQDLGYGWTLETVDPIKNIYDIQLTKQGTAFAAASASSGERELLTYVFTIFALNVRDAIIVVDEPELHLHPTWQKKLLDVFGAIATSTGNQFLLATHSPTFISPQSIQFVSRVFSVNQSSQILRLDTSALPDNRHLLSIVNSQNNERLFFADKVVLVEGISDRIFFEAILNIHARESVRTKTIEIISVGGKGLFATYAKLLNACKIEFAIIADLDYVDQIGTGDIKALFRIDESEIKNDVIENVKSLDGASLVARIDEAMRTGRWSDARATWDYIKSKRLLLRTDLAAEEQAKLDAFCTERAAEHVHILRKGALEAYLPEGCRSKDIGKLVAFLDDNNFWQRLSKEARDELGGIARSILELLEASDLAGGDDGGDGVVTPGAVVGYDMGY